MRLHSVGFDLHQTEHISAPIVQRLIQLDAKPFLAPVWMLKSPNSVWEVRQDLLRYLHVTKDRLIIADVTSAPLAWHNVDIKGSPFARLSQS